MDFAVAAKGGLAFAPPCHRVWVIGCNFTIIVQSTSHESYKNPGYRARLEIPHMVRSLEP
jgi:hypothetical protein